LLLVLFNEIFTFSCECTESRLSSIAATSRRHHRRRRHHPSSRLNPHRTNSNIRRQISAPMSTVTSYRSDSPIDDEDQSTINNDDTQYLSSEIQTLPQPDLIASIKTRNLNQEYCHHLKQMADLSNQQRLNEQSSSMAIPFFGKDDHLMNTERNQMPTSTLEKNVLFN
jgi:hypothetical protein